LRSIAQYLVFLVAKVLDSELRGRAHLHRKLVRTLRLGNKLKKVVFVSTNYDILIDNALTEQYRNGVDLDYGIEFRNFDRSDDWIRPVLKRRVGLFKPHGSLNWLFCATCNEIEITPKEKGVVTRLISGFANEACSLCGSVYSPLIVPPTFYKDLNNVFLSSIWNRTDIALRGVKHIIFCGYSFPDADIHIKYLLKRAQTNRNRPLKITVINNHNGKKQDDARREEDRYKRFLGEKVNYTAKSFENFVADPLGVLRS
jgi:SIR2-like domain